MIKKLVEAGVHFGHLVSRWCPKMKPYIWGHRNKIHLIDVSKTAYQLDKAAQFLESVAADGKQVLWVGTKKAAQNPVKEIAEKAKSPYVNHRWIGGTLTNPLQVKKSVTKLAHYEDVVANAAKSQGEDAGHYTKKEINSYQKLAGRLDKNVGGIRTLKWPLGAIVIVDVRKEAAALKEAVKAGVPVVALVDTNSDPSLVDYVIPSNDDAPKAINFILNHLADALEKGVQAHKKNAAQLEQKRAEEKKEKAAAAAEKAVKKAVKESADTKAAKSVEKKKVAPKKQATAKDEKASVSKDSAE